MFLGFLFNKDDQPESRIGDAANVVDTWASGSECKATPAGLKQQHLKCWFQPNMEHQAEGQRSELEKQQVYPWNKSGTTLGESRVEEDKKREVDKRLQITKSHQKIKQWLGLRGDVVGNKKDARWQWRNQSGGGSKTIQALAENSDLKIRANNGGAVQLIVWKMQMKLDRGGTESGRSWVRGLMVDRMCLPVANTYHDGHFPITVTCFLYILQVNKIKKIDIHTHTCKHTCAL